MKQFHLLLFLVLISLSSTSLHAVHLSGSLQFTARMNGSNEVPAVITDAEGLGVFTLSKDKTALDINVSVSGLTGDITGIHLHKGEAGENGPVIFNLSDFINGKRIKARLTNLTAEEVATFLSGGYYLNVHTDMNPGGEIRAQVLLESDFRYTAMLHGDQEVPAVATDAYGLGVFNLSKSGYKLQIHVVVQGLSGPITGAHFHQGAPGENGGVVENLSSFVNGNVITATVDPTAYLSALQSGNIYFNVHTDANPGGEIRGQVMLDDALYFDAALDGSQENPAVMTSASGIAKINVNNTLDEISYNIVLDGLSGSGATAAHFHTGTVGNNGGVVVNLSADIVGNQIMGSQPISKEFLNALLSGGIYLNVHTDANPGGEIRGQVYRLAREGYLYDFNGGQEVPPSGSTGTGVGMASIDRDQSNAHFMMVVTDLSAPIDAGHFHNARPNSNGGVIFNLSSFFTSVGGAYGYWTENDTEPFNTHVAKFRSKSVYANVHTANFPGGEVRGNVVRGSEFFEDTATDPMFSGDLLIAGKLSGASEVPPVMTDAVGVTSFLLNDSQDAIEVNVSVNGLSGPITGIHVHEGAVGQNGDVIFNLTDFVNGNRVSTTLTGFSTDQLAKFLTGAYYLNVHTANNPGGEIRTQLALETETTYHADLTGNQENPAVVTDAYGLATFNYTPNVNKLEVNVLVQNLSGPITGAHLHVGAPGVNGGVVENLTAMVDGNHIHGVVFPEAYLADLQAGNVYVNIHTEANPGGEIRGQLTLDNGLTFDTWLSGSQEVPASVTEAIGLAAVTLSPTFDQITYRVVTDGLSGNLDAAHFHSATLGQNGGVVLNLSADITGSQIKGSTTAVTQDLIDAMLTGQIYINVHTPAFPGGEIRGQLFRLARDGYGYDLCSDQETSDINAPTATGGGMASIDRHLTNAHVMIVASGLTGDITGAHIHQGMLGEDGGVIFNMTDLYSNGGIFTYWSDMNSTPFTTDYARAIQEANTYANIHTALHPGGEIRGQIIKDLTCPPLALVDCETNPLTVEHTVICDFGNATYTVNVTIMNGVGPYTITGDLNDVIESNTFTIGPFVDGTTYNFAVEDGNGCTASVNSEIIACSKIDCETNPISVTHIVDCDEPSGTYTVNVTIMNGIAPYTITGDLNDVIQSNTFTIGPFTDGTTYNFAVEDGNGCTASVNSDVIACSKVDCNTTPLTIQDTFVCSQDNEANTYVVNVTVVNGTAPYNLTGTVIDVIQDDTFQLGPFESGTSYTINIADANGCTASVMSDLIDCKILPVEFLSFEGEVLEEGNKLQWVTASETNNDFFLLERSFDGQSFENLTKVTGVGNSNSPSRYEYLDRETTASITYYRLSQTDLDGRTEFLGTISLQRGESDFEWVSVKPVPAQDWLNVAFNTSTNQSLSIQIYDVSGRLLFQEQINSYNNQVTTLDIDVRSLQTGVYLLQVNNGQANIHHKFMKY
ncbi:MAG: CHRD domain-containing protein [Chitinophagales bacterium]